MAKGRDRRREAPANERVEKARQRFRHQRIHRQPEVDNETRAMHRTRKRIIGWAMVVVVIVAVVGTWLQRRQVVEPQVVRIKITHGAPVPVLGAAANLPEGLREVREARLAGLEGLAEGSVLAQETQLALSKERGWPIEVENSIGMRFRLVPHSSFVIGSPEDQRLRAPDETARVATVRAPIYVGKYEVTQAQWERVMGAGTNPSDLKGPERPVEGITWHDARAFITKLCELEGVPRWSYRLPYEAEWEYACRAGTRSDWYSGESPQELQNYALFYWNVTNGHEPVGQRRPNAWGLYNMHGNVWEWCLEKFYYYEDLETRDDLRRVIRGGNWRLKPEECRSASRYRLPPDSHSNLLGFRVVRSIFKPAPPVFHGTVEDRERFQLRQDALLPTSDTPLPTK